MHLPRFGTLWGRRSGRSFALIEFGTRLKSTKIWAVVRGSVGRAVATDSSGLWFESSSNWQKIILNVYCHCSEKTDENKEKEAGIGPFKKKNHDIVYGR